MRFFNRVFGRKRKKFLKLNQNITPNKFQQTQKEYRNILKSFINNDDRYIVNQLLPQVKQVGIKKQYNYLNQTLFSNLPFNLKQIREKIFIPLNKSLKNAIRALLPRESVNGKNLKQLFNRYKVLHNRFNVRTVHNKMRIIRKGLINDLKPYINNNNIYTKQLHKEFNMSIKIKNAKSAYKILTNGSPINLRTLKEIESLYVNPLKNKMKAELKKLPIYGINNINISRKTAVQLFKMYKSYKVRGELMNIYKGTVANNNQKNFSNNVIKMVRKANLNPMNLNNSDFQKIENFKRQYNIYMNSKRQYNRLHNEAMPGSGGGTMASRNEVGPNNGRRVFKTARL